MPHPVTIPQSTSQLLNLSPSQSHSQIPSQTSPQQFTPSSENPSSVSDLFSRNIGANTPGTSISDPSFNFNNDSFVSYDGFYNWGNHISDVTSNAGTGPINDDSMNNFPLPTNNFSWQNMPMDIDQDWSWFLSDGSTNAQTNAAQTVGDQFTKQGFVGFG